MGTPQTNHSTAKLMVDIIFRSSTNMRHILVVNYNVFEEYNNNDKYLNLFGFCNFSSSASDTVPMPLE